MKARLYHTAVTIGLGLGLGFGTLATRSVEAYGADHSSDLIPKPATNAQMTAAYPLLRRLFDSVISPGKSVDDVYAEFPEAFRPHDDQLLPVLVRVNMEEEARFAKSPVAPKKYQEWRETQYGEAFRKIEDLNDRVTKAGKIDGRDVLEIIQLSMRLKKLESREFLAPTQLQAEFALARTKRKLVNLVEAEQLKDPSVTNRNAKPEKVDSESGSTPASLPPAGSGEAGTAN